MLPPESKAGKLSVPAEVSREFDMAREYMEGASRAAMAMAGCLILCGVELLRLHKIYGVKAGRPGNSRNDSGISIPWGELVQKEMGFGDDKARYCMAMAEEAKRRIPVLQSKDLLTTPLMMLSTGDRDEIVKAVAKVTDGNTIKSLMAHWGISKKAGGAQGGGNGRTPGSGGKLSLDEMAQKEIWPVLEAIGDLNMQPNVEAMIYALPLVADANEGQQAGLQFLKQELQKTLGMVEDAIKHQRGKGGRGRPDPLDE